MARNAKINRRTPKEQQQGNILPFVTGLSIGLFIAFIVYLKGAAVNHNKPEIEIISDTIISNSDDLVAEKPQFDFYVVLPEREVKVPEWEPPKAKTMTGEEVNTSAHIFQVGSFQKHSDADRVKAKLVMLGLPVTIQRVVINGQEIWFRVRVGPYKDMSKIDNVRKRLSSNNLNFIVYKIKDDN